MNARPDRAEETPKLELVTSASPLALGAPADSGDARSVAQREHVLFALVELTRELAGFHDPYEVSDLALFNLMGQIQTSKAALWLIPYEDAPAPVLFRCYGIPKPWARAVGTIFGKPEARQRVESIGPIEAEHFAQYLDAGDRKLIKEAQLGLFAPIVAWGSVCGFLGLGSRIGGDSYQPIHLQVLQSSLGIMGVSLENTRLYNNLKEKNRQLRHAAENLKEMDRLKTEFISNVNHELRTPLTIVCAYIELLQTTDEDPERRKEFLEIMMGESRKLLALFERLLDFSSVSSKTMEIALQTGGLVPFLRSFHEERMPGVVERLREFRLRLEEPIPDCQFDPRRLGQILNAILDNAVKFTPSGSCITLCGGMLEENGTRWTKVDVVDDGPGVPADRMAVLFEAFRQGDGSATRAVGGMGIGLALARKLAEQMGGDLRIESAVGKGSTFSVLMRAA